MQTYSPEDTILICGGSIISGYADGTFISIEREVDAYTKVVGADGEVSRTRSANRSGTLTLTLKQTSNSNKVLGAKQALDEAGDLGVFNCQMVDNNGYLLFSSRAWIRKPPTFEYGTDEGNREWSIDLEKIVYDYPIV